MVLIDKLKTAIDSLTLGERIIGGLQVALFGMLVVFIILLCIMVGINLLYKFAGDSKKVPSTSISTEETTMTEEDRVVAVEEYGELVAVISAAIANSLDTPIHNIKVKNITRIPDPTPPWGKYSRMQQLR